MIAEGDAAMCNAYRRFLTQSGFKVENAIDGVDCLTKIQHGTLAAVVLDRELLWGGGDGVLARLNEESTTAGLPVILMCADTPQNGDFQAAASAGVTLLRKPFVLRDLLESVCAALAGRAERAEEPVLPAPEHV